MKETLLNLSELMNDIEGNLQDRPALTLAVTIYELGQLIENMSDGEYASIPGEQFTSSIGGQTRHTLDHIRIFVNNFRNNTVDYENRDRGTAIETSRSTALATIEGLIEQLLEIKPDELHDPVTVSVLLHSEARPPELQSTAGREIAFLLNHTIHHNALVSIMLKTMGKEVSEGFGYAPATIQYLSRR